MLLNDKDSNFIDDDTLVITLENDAISKYKKDIEMLQNLIKDIKTYSHIGKGIYELKYTSYDNMLYYPLIKIQNDEYNIKVSPVSLVDSEFKFLNKLKEYLETTKDEMEVYVIRNKSKSGVALFADTNFYPDFIMWVLKDNIQYINFIDPHGLMHTDISDPKIEMYKSIKEIEKVLNTGRDSKVILNSFILSPTDFTSLPKSIYTQQDWEDKNVIFQVESEDYIKQIFDKLTP